jgi:hypothetical protein
MSGTMSEWPQYPTIVGEVRIRPNDINITKDNFSMDFWVIQLADGCLNPFLSSLTNMSSGIGLNR